MGNQKYARMYWMALMIQDFISQEFYQEHQDVEAVDVHQQIDADYTKVMEASQFLSAWLKQRA